MVGGKEDGGWLGKGNAEQLLSQRRWPAGVVALFSVRICRAWGML